MNPQPSPLVIGLAIVGGIALGLVIIHQLNQQPLLEPESGWKRVAREGANAAIGGVARAVATKILG